MSGTKNTIIIPWDFTEVADYALQHAVPLAKSLGNKILMLHIIDESASEEKRVKSAASAEEDFVKVVADAKSKLDFDEISSLVRVGNIFTTINDVATEVEASVLFMGTHGMKGMQKILGSWALKVIEGSSQPFVVVQQPPVKIGYGDIVFPLDFKTENIEKLKWVDFLAKNFKSKVHIINKKYTDPSLKKKLDTNLLSAKKYLTGKGIAYEIITADIKGKFHEQTIDYAKKINADLILIATTKDINTVDYVLGAPEQQIIANRHSIPVMTINPSKTTTLGRSKPYSF